MVAITMCLSFHPVSILPRVSVAWLPVPRVQLPVPRVTLIGTKTPLKRIHYFIWPLSPSCHSDWYKETPQTYPLVSMTSMTSEPWLQSPVSLWFVWFMNKETFNSLTCHFKRASLYFLQSRCLTQVASKVSSKIFYVLYLFRLDVL